MRSPTMPKIGTVAMIKEEKDADVSPVPRFSTVKYSDMPIPPAIRT